MPQYPLTSLNMSERGYAKVLNLPRYRYSNIFIIVTNVIMLESLSAQFLHAGAPLSFYLFLTQVRTSEGKF